MNNVKKLWITTLTLLTILIFCSGITKADNYNHLAKGVGKVRVYSCDKLTTNILENRGTDIVVEKIIGICKDRKGNGEIINCTDPEHNYISYKRVKGRYVGAIILTVCIYQPCSKGEDDIVARFDYILGDR